MNVWTAYRSLGAEQKQILKDKQVDLARPIDELLALLQPLAACDKAADKSRTKLGCSFAAAIVVTIALAVMTGPFAVIPLAAAVLLGMLYFFTRKVDLSNNFRDFALPVLTVFREDIDTTKPVHLRLTLDPPTAKQKMTKEMPAYKQGVYHKVIDRTYVDKWMTATALLVDGTRMSWSVTDNILVRSKTKKTPRGKYKSKTKYKKKTELEVELALRKKTYSLADAGAVAPVQGVVSASDDKRHKVQMEREVRSDSLDPLDPRALIDLVADVYRKTRRPVKEAGA
jgi:hypothetical protein